jgi:hypothetical protein
MGVTERKLAQAEARTQALRHAGYAVSARYNRRASRIVVALNTGLQFTFPTTLAEGLASGAPDDLAVIEITPSGLGLHWPRLDADLYIPALLQGTFGSRKWMASQLGAVGGRARSAVKAASSRENGKKGGRPRKKLAAG